MGVTIRIVKDRYYLDIKWHGARHLESLGLRRTRYPSQNRELDRLAEMCRTKKEMQLLSGEYDIIDTTGARLTLYEYMQSIAEGKGEKNHYAKALRYLEKFPGGKEIRLGQINSDWLISWQEFLLAQDRLSKTTAKHYDDAVRCTLNQAVRERKIQRNPADEIRALVGVQKVLPVLTVDDLAKLSATPIYGRLGAEIKRAFLFACYTGLRISDVRSLTWRGVQDGRVRILRR